MYQQKRNLTRGKFYDGFMHHVLLCVSRVQLGINVGVNVK